MPLFPLAAGSPRKVPPPMRATAIPEGERKLEEGFKGFRSSPAHRLYPGRVPKRIQEEDPGSLSRGAKGLARVPLAGKHPGIEKFLEQIFILSEGDRIEPAYLPPERTASATPPLQSGDSPFRLPPQGVHLESLERDLIRQALEISSGTQVRRAKLPGISRDLLRYQMSILM